MSQRKDSRKKSSTSQSDDEESSSPQSDQTKPTLHRVNSIIQVDVTEDIKDKVEDGVTDFQQIKHKILDPLIFDIQNNNDNNQIVTDHALNLNDEKKSNTDLQTNKDHQIAEHLWLLENYKLEIVHSYIHHMQRLFENYSQYHRMSNTSRTVFEHKIDESKSETMNIFRATNDKPLRLVLTTTDNKMKKQFYIAIKGKRSGDSLETQNVEMKKDKCGEFCDDMMDINELKDRCEPFKRITNILQTYKQLLETMREVKLFDIIRNRDTYDHQQLFDDFLHIKIIHIDADNDKIRSHDHLEDNKPNERYLNICKKICEYFEKDLKLKCNHEADCRALSRHYERDRVVEENVRLCTEDAAFRSECDKIHIYFLHSTIKFGINCNQTNAEEEGTMDGINRYIERRSYFKRFSNDDQEQSQMAGKYGVKQKIYIGKRDDDIWWKHIDPNDEKQDKEQIYRKLVEKMGVFRWQTPHGFEAGKNQEISHYKPKYQNIKEEVLYNQYQELNKDNWNQTLRKSGIFFNSWASRRISTKYKGYYKDQVTRHEKEWKEGDAVERPDIVALKLYTDFDKLQFVLKKCFRFEAFDRILRQIDDMTNDEFILEKERLENAKLDLKNRLETFYHWRKMLLTVLNKFGTKLNSENNMILYHGVNAKMIIQTAQTYAFNGPLSTTSSYHVGRTFATAKGMVLKITSYFPRQNFCNAFDASSISDYPEEQEWLVGFMYVRLLKVRTRKLVDNIASFNDFVKKMNLSSFTREIFFAIHLFKEQIFSMSEHLERIQAQFLKVNRRECCDEKVQETYKKQSEEFQDWSVECMCYQFCEMAGHTHKKQQRFDHDHNESDKDLTEEQQLDMHRNKKLYPIIWKKFNEFRARPNLKQRIKFDTISDHLKRFFMEEIEEKNIETGNKRWIISFDEMTKVYPNVKEIHFINQYKFDDIVLNHLLEQIDKSKNTIQKIVFLYYNYKNTAVNDKHSKPLNHKIFKDPETLDESLINILEGKGWVLKHNKNGNAGYKIRIFNAQSG